MKYPDISVVVQGPFDPYIYEKYQYTKKYRELFDKIIISCYDTDDTSCFREEDGVVLVKNPLPTHPHNPANMYYHAFSTLMGVNEVETEFVIKVRSSDFYWGIDKFADAILETPDKYVNISLGICRPHISALRPSDRMIGCRTKSMKRAMENIIRWCHYFNSEVSRSTPCLQMIDVPEIKVGFQSNAETSFYLAFLESIGYSLPEVEPPSNIMYETINVVNVEDMKPFVWCTHPGGGPLYRETFGWDEHQNPHVVTCNEDIYWPPRS